MKMAFQSFKNVWGKGNRNNSNRFGPEGPRSSFKMDGRQEFVNKQMEQNDASQCRQLTFGAFGSKFGTTSGPVSLPTDGWNNINSKFYTFEIGSSSSGSSSLSSTPGSGPNSFLSFGMEPKNYDWAIKSFAEFDSASRGSSQSSKNNGTKRHFDWGGMVENVFKEEIGKMAESFQTTFPGVKNV